MCFGDDAGAELVITVFVGKEAYLKAVNGTEPQGFCVGATPHEVGAGRRWAN